MQAKIPQDVQREDKIIGPFTLRQFLYLLAGGMSGYITYSIIGSLISTGVGFIFGFLIFAFISAFAVIQIQGMPLPSYVMAFIMFNLRPRKRVWRKDIFIPDIASVPSKKAEALPPINPSEVKSELEKLAHIIDTRGWAELAEEKEEEEVSTIYKKFEEKKTGPEEKKPFKEVETALGESLKEKQKREAEIAKFAKESAKTAKEVTAEPAKEAAKQEVEIKAEIKKELKQKKVIQKKSLEKLKTAVLEIEKIVKKPEKTRVIKKKKQFVPKIISFSWPIKPKTKREKPAYLEEYKIDLENRVTTPRIEVPKTNIKVDESKLEDVLEDTEKIKTIEKEIKEVEIALQRQAAKKKPLRIVKGAESFVDLEDKEKKVFDTSNIKRENKTVKTFSKRNRTDEKINKVKSMIKKLKEH